ncbi:MAG: transcriptional repressor [Bacteroidales bacterium]|nr:transcriptional repressor [Bacteroidales bacterium]
MHNNQTKTVDRMAQFREALRSHSLKATAQRIAVHEAMIALGHASADSVAEWIKDNGKCNVSVATVYNILSQMALLGVYHHRMSANNKMYFDVNTNRHIHLYDIQNNEYLDVVDKELTDFIDNRIKSRKFKGFKVESIDIQIIGRPNRRTARQQ